MSDELVSKNMQNILRCAICRNAAEHPKTLSCQHTFCYKCLNKYIITKGQHTEIECPVCGKCFPLPNGDLDNIPVSFVYTQLNDANISADDNPPSDGNKDLMYLKVCSSRDCTNTATSFCKTCKYICSTCTEDHRTINVLKTHTILTLTEGLEIQRNVFPLCSRHLDKPLEVYCETCSKPICFMCRVLSHDGHTCTELLVKAEEEKQKLESIITEIINRLSRCEDDKRTVTLHFVKLREDGNIIKRNASMAIDDIREKLQSHQHVIDEEVLQRYRQAEKSLDLESDRIDLVQMCLISLRYHCDKLYLYGTPCDYVTQVGSLEQVLHYSIPGDEELILQELDITETEQKVQGLKVRKLKYI